MEQTGHGNSSYYDLQRIFLRGTTVRDIAEPLLSFDSWSDAEKVRAILESQRAEYAGVRENGWVTGYIILNELGAGACGEYAHPFDEEQVLQDNTPLVEMVLHLADTPFAFVRAFGEVAAIVTREDMQDPPVRMWLFGMVTLIELYYLRLIERNMTADEWRQYLSPARFAKAEELLEERRRRGQNPSLLDCLQFGDKAQIIARDEGLRNQVGYVSRKRADLATKMLERLRNNLAHTQDIVAWDWDTIVVLAQNIDRLIRWDESVR